MRSLWAGFMLSVTLSLGAQNLINVKVHPEKDSFGRLNFFDVCETQDGYFAVGAQSNALGQSILSLASIGYGGNLFWKKDFRKITQQGAELVWRGERISYTLDGGCYVFASERSQQGLQGLLLKISREGNLVWSLYLDFFPPVVTGSSYNQSDLITDKDGNAVLVGADIYNSWIGHVAKVSPGGTLIFNKSLNGKDDYALNLVSLAETSTGDYLLAGLRITEDFRNGRDQLALFKLSPNGSLLWSKNYFTGSWTNGDSMKAYPFSIALSPKNEIIIAGQVRKGSISNNQAFILFTDIDGNVLKKEVVYENKYPGQINENYIDKVFVHDKYVMYNFRVGEFNHYGIDLQNYQNGTEILQTGYAEIPALYNRRFELVNKYGQAVFVGGGRFFNGDNDYGLVLTATKEGLWNPPTLVSIDTQTLYPRLMSHSKPHIGVNRVVEFSTELEFKNKVYEADLTNDTSFLKLNSLASGSYYLRIGTKGQFGNIVYNVPVNYQVQKGWRFATRVVDFSTEYSNSDWSASRALFPPDVFPNYGDHRNAWAASSADSRREFLHLGFNFPAPIKGLVVYETFNPGSIDSIYAKNPINGQWVLLFSQTSKSENQVSRAWKIEFKTTDFPVSEIRLAINSPSVAGYNEIDAVGLIDADVVGSNDFISEESIIKYIIVANNELIIKWNDENKQDIKRIHILSVYGQQILATRVNDKLNESAIDLSRFPKGIYVLQVDNFARKQSLLFFR